MLDRARDLMPCDPATLVPQIFGVRLALGVVLACAPRWSWRRVTGRPQPSDEAVLAVRMLGARDIALGLGGLMAARRDGAVRGWAEAGVLVDAVDAGAVAVSPGVSGWRRPAAVLAAGGTAAVGLVAAQSIEGGGKRSG